MKKFYHIGINFQSIPRVLEIEHAIAASGSDWMRYGAGSWIAWSPRNANEIYLALAPLLSQADNILVAALNLTDRSGYMPQWAWDWIDEKQGEQTSQSRLASIFADAAKSK